MSVQDFYDRYWSSEGYNPAGGLSPSVRRIYEAHIRSDDDCLDLGCGNGRTNGPWLTEHAGSYVGVDVSENALDQASAIGLDVRKIADATMLPFTSESFDVVVCTEVLEHLYDPETAAKEIRRVLRPGGRTVITVPNGIHWRIRSDLLIGRWNPRGDDRGAQEPWRSPHVRFFSPKTLARMLAKVGLEVVEDGGITELPFVVDIPGLRRLSRGSGPGPVYRRLYQRVPSLFAAGLYAVAVRR